MDNPYIIPDPNRIYANEDKMAIARDMLERYTGTPPDDFEKQIILTNFGYYLEQFYENSRLCHECCSQ